MKVGSKWQVWIPAELGYGAQGAGQHIGPNAMLIFEIELVAVQ
jgi:FKBP-type peptidyl-prolyl cis-trans isomerase